MEIPQELREALGIQIAGIKKTQMINDAQVISMRYRTRSGNGERLVANDNEAVAYAVSRMPATFGAVYATLEHVFEVCEYKPKTLLDVGSGTGAVAWAAKEQLDLQSITCLEREAAMRRIGQEMMQHGTQVLRDAKWINFDLTLDKISNQSDLVVASYILNEMKDEARMSAIKKLWDATNGLLVLIEPGTPVGFDNLIKAREALIKCGAYVVAPCPHQEDCLKVHDDWCHFACRVNRSSLHRELKGGEAPYEDEKFMYIALTREKYSWSGLRILRHPQVRKGHVMLEVCTSKGIENIKFSKKDGEVYKQARKAKAGDIIL